MQSENEKSSSPLNDSAVLNSFPKSVAQPIASSSLKRNEKQQLLHHTEKIIDIQEMLYSLSTENTESKIRQDFLYGLHGAPKLSQEDFEILKIFRRLTTSEQRPKTISEFNLNIPNEANLTASKHLKSLLEGERERVPGTKISYYDGKAVVSRILRSGYFSQIRFNNSKANLLNSAIQQPATNLTGSPSSDYEEVFNAMATLKKKLEEIESVPNLEASAHFKSPLDGESKRVPGTTDSYYDGKAVVSRNLRSGYFSKIRFNNSNENLLNSAIQRPATNLTGSPNFDFEKDYDDVCNAMTTLQKKLEDINFV